jgi:hypothetical protein
VVSRPEDQGNCPLPLDWGSVATPDGDTEWLELQEAGV